MQSPLAPQLLSNRSYRAAAEHEFLRDLSLRRGRVHEFCGDARRTMAMLIAGQIAGETNEPLFWIRPRHRVDGLYPAGMRRFVDATRLLFVGAEKPLDILWSMEEILRAGQIPLVIAELPEPPPLTPVRRLQLAAEEGATRRGGPGGKCAAIGLLLTPGDGGAAGIESRWKAEARLAHGLDEDYPTREGKPAWQLTRLRARSAPPGSRALVENNPGEITVLPPG